MNAIKLIETITSAIDATLILWDAKGHQYRMNLEDLQGLAIGLDVCHTYHTSTEADDRCRLCGRMDDPLILVHECPPVGAEPESTEDARIEAGGWCGMIDELESGD
jgi:hypothetical protein